MGFIDDLFNGTFMPHGHCFLWRQDLLVMHVGGDVATAAAYFAIPAALVTLVRKRDDLEFNWVFLMFALFIFCCGVTHLMAAVNVWQGYYHIEGVAKTVTAVVSLITAFLVWRLLPQALTLPGRRELVKKNDELFSLQEQLQTANRELESRVEQRTRELEQLAATDPVTGLANRRELMRQLTDELSRAHRYERSLSVLMIDIDNFKNLNDTYGHQAGDQVLAEFADILRSSCRSADIIARYGGEEFVVLAPETSLQQAGQFAKLVLDEVRARSFALDDQTITVSCSIGVTATRADDSVDRILTRADKAMYHAKASGKNDVVVFEEIL